MMEKTVVANGSRWAHKTSGKLYKILDFRAKTSTVLIEPVDGSEKPKPITTSTLKRLYNQLEEVGKEVKEEKKEDSKAKAEKPVKESSKKSEKTEKKQPKEKKKATGISESVRLELKDQLVEFLNKLEFEAKTYEKYPFSISARFPEKTIFSVELRNTHIRLRGISELLPRGLEFKAVKGGFDVTLNYKYEDVDKMKSVIKYTAENFSDSELVKRKSKNKKKTE